jgi:hypothetical protein
MPDIARVGAAQDARKATLVKIRHPDADHAHAHAQEAVHRLGEMRQLVDQQHVHLGALVLVHVLLVLAVAEIDPRAVLEADLVLDDLAAAVRDPFRQQGPQPARALDMVLRQVVAVAAEQVDLQCGNCRRPGDRAQADQVALAAARGAAVERLSRVAFEREHLLRVQVPLQCAR